ncbi:MAG: hypothetical protein HC893_11220 [Chloroflexaceae bacterium]|nr:hypothetical protein [Chloroflexaceae bacterium]
MWQPQRARNVLATYIIGKRAQAYFGLGPEAMGDWGESLRAIVGVDERKIAGWVSETGTTVGSFAQQAGTTVGGFAQQAGTNVVQAGGTLSVRLAMRRVLPSRPCGEPPLLRAQWLVAGFRAIKRPNQPNRPTSNTHHKMVER